MNTFFKRAIIAGSAYFLAKGLYKYIKEKQFTYRYKVVLITGGSRGLGLVMARQLAKEGAYLSICSNNKQELEEARHQLEKLGASVVAVHVDVTDPGAAEKVIEQTIAQFGRLEILINNAGRMIVGPLNSQTQENFDELMKIHFYAPMRFIDTALPQLRQHKGRIMNISSIGGKISSPHLLSYSASKFALTGLSEGLYTELKREGVIVTTACPGLMQTGSPRNVDVVGLQEEEYRWFKISDSLPILSMNAEKASKKLLNACRRGDPEYIMTVPAKVVSVLHGISPSLVIRMSELLNRVVLPKPVENTNMIKGYETQYEYDRSPITRTTDEAAKRNNELI